MKNSYHCLECNLGTKYLFIYEGFTYNIHYDANGVVLWVSIKTTIDPVDETFIKNNGKYVNEVRLRAYARIAKNHMFDKLKL